FVPPAGPKLFAAFALAEALEAAAWLGTCPPAIRGSFRDSLAADLCYQRRVRRTLFLNDRSFRERHFPFALRRRSGAGRRRRAAAAFRLRSASTRHLGPLFQPGVRAGC